MLSCGRHASSYFSYLTGRWQDKTESKTVVVEPKSQKDKENPPPKFVRTLSPMPPEAFSLCKGIKTYTLLPTVNMLPSLCSFARTSGARTLVSICSECRTALSLHLPGGFAQERMPERKPTRRWCHQSAWSTTFASQCHLTGTVAHLTAVPSRANTRQHFKSVSCKQ